MGKDRFCVFNGHVSSLYEPLIPFSNRAFRFGDALFESIRFCNGKIMFLPEHTERVKLSMTVLRMNVPPDFTSDKIKSLAEELIKKNNDGANARLRLTVLRQNGSLYSPDNNDISFLLESEKMEEGYQLNTKGWWVDVYSEIKKPLNKLMNLKSANALLYVMAGISKQSMKLDECFIVNEKGNICESISSNVFVVKNKSLFTPPLEEGAVAGVMRKQIMKIAAEKKILCFENTITNYSLLNADEIFLTNAIRGIQWVGQFKEKFYGKETATLLMEELLKLT